MLKTCVYVRSYYDSPYLNFFLEHYIKLGFDKIFILKADDLSYDIDPKFKSKITILDVPNLGNGLLPKYDYLVKKSNYDWALCIDTDEFLLLNEKYSNIQEFLTDKLSQNNDINVIYFRWGIIEKFDNLDLSFSKIFNEYNIFSNHHIKSMIKIKNLKCIFHPHLCQMDKPIIYFENNILTNQKPNNHSITENSYQDSVLIHLHTRSIKNLTIKSLKTKLNKKHINDLDNFNNLIENYHNFNNKELFSKFKSFIGLKAQLPFAHITKPINLNNYQISTYNNKIIDNIQENEILKNLLNENYNNFILMENKLNEFIINLGKFIKK